MSTAPNPKDAMGAKKVALHLWPHVATVYGALAMADGAEKYGAYNWREHPVKATVYVSALERHVAAYFDGEENATDSGKPHLAHALACLAILVDAKESGNLIDDRPTAGPSAAVLARFAPPSGEASVHLGDLSVLSEEQDTK